MEPEIINRGRGPEIAGTRITVYDIIDYWQTGWHHTAIAAQFRLSSAQVLAAIRYIEEHKEDVMAAYQRILERSASYKNSPEVEAKLVESRAKLRAFRENLRAAKTEGSGDARNGARQ